MVSLHAEKKIDITIPLLNGATGTVFFGRESTGFFPLRFCLHQLLDLPQFLRLEMSTSGAKITAQT